MVDIKDIVVSANYGTKCLLVTFTTTDCAEDFSRYRFDIYRSYSVSGPFELYSSDVQSMEFVDNRVNLLNTTIHYYYKVNVVDIVDGTAKMSDKVGYIENHPADNYASAIADIERMYLQNAINNDIIYLAKSMKYQILVCRKKIYFHFLFVG